MKTWIKGMVLALSLTVAMSVSAFAADFTHSADALKDLGLFQGGETGYELDRAATRAEAGAMLVRLLGQEEAAKALTYSAPFTDVPAWAQPYVQYLFDKGLTAGKTETTFGTTDPCTAQMYSTFLLRALGYSDKAAGDFTYETAIAFGTKIGLVDYANCNEKTFLRDHVAAMSFTALATKTAKGETNLLADLVKSGAIKDAKGYDKMFADFDKYKTVMAANAKQTQSHIKAETTMSLKSAGVALGSGKLTLDMMMDLNMEKYNLSKISMVGKFDASVSEAILPTDNKISGDIAYYYTDGVMYMNMMDQKVKMPLDIDGMMKDMGTLTGQTSEPISMYKTFSEKDGVYTVSLATTSFNSMFKNMMSMMDTDLPEAAAIEMTLSKFDMTITTANGAVTKQTADMGMSVTAEGQTIDLSMQMNMDIVPGAVTITLPTDLSTYTDMLTPAVPETPAA